MKTTDTHLGDVVTAPTEPFEGLSSWPYQPMFTDVGGLNMHHIDTGPRTGDPVVLLHGLPAWGYLYRHMIPALVEAGRRVLVPDLIGFGRSDKPVQPSTYTLDNHLSWLSAWFANVDTGPATIVCHDWGGLIGLRVIAAKPSRCSALTLLDTSLNDGTEPFSEKYLHGFGQWKRFLQTAPTISPAAIIGPQLANGLTAEEARAYDAPFPTEAHYAGLRTNDTLYPITPNAPGAAGNAAAKHQLAKLDIPIDICFSGHAEIHHPGMHDHFRRLFGPDRIRSDQTIDGTCHFFQEQAPDTLCEVILSTN